jgi:hypothetical protein
MVVSIRQTQVVRRTAVHVAIGITLEGQRDCLGLWIERSEGARFWTSVLTDLRNRGVRDILFVCTDTAPGFQHTLGLWMREFSDYLDGVPNVVSVPLLLLGLAAFTYAIVQRGAEHDER